MLAHFISKHIAIKLACSCSYASFDSYKWLISQQ